MGLNSEKMQQGRLLQSSLAARRAVISQSEQQMMARAVHDVAIPRVVQEFLYFNPDKQQIILKMVMACLSRSMKDPRTRPRILGSTWSDDAAKERLEIIYDCMTRAVGEGHMSLKKLADRMWDMVVARMVNSEHADDVAERESGSLQESIGGDASVQGQSWGKSAGMGGVGVATITPKQMADIRDEE